MPQKQSRPLLGLKPSYSVGVERTYRYRVDLVILPSEPLHGGLLIRLTLSLSWATRSVTVLSPNPYAGPKLPLV